MYFHANPASAQLLYQQGRPVTESQTSLSADAPISTTQAAQSTDPLGPVEAVIAGTRFPASAISTPDGKPVPLGKEEKSTAGVVQPSDSPDWPRDTVEIFVTACAKTQTQLIAPCKCVIEHLAYAIAQNEFLALTQSGEIETDKRYLKAQATCLGSTPSQPHS